MTMSKATRREILRRMSALSCVGAAASTFGLQLATMGEAAAQTASTYKALVCIFLFGGNDSNSMIVPIDSRYSAYRAVRGPVAIDGSLLLPAGGSGYGLHPSLTNIHRFYGQQHAAAVASAVDIARGAVAAEADQAVQQLERCEPRAQLGNGVEIVGSARIDRRAAPERSLDRANRRRRRTATPGRCAQPPPRRPPPHARAGSGLPPPRRPGCRPGP